MTSASKRYHNDLDAGTVTAFGAGILAVLTAVVTGFWQWMSGKRKSEGEAQANAQAAALSGLGSLIAFSQAHIERLEKRSGELEGELQKCERRILILERTLMHNNIQIPNGDDQYG